MLTNKNKIRQIEKRIEQLLGCLVFEGKITLTDAYLYYTESTDEGSFEPDAYSKMSYIALLRDVRLYKKLSRENENETGYKTEPRLVVTKNGVRL